MYAIIRTGGKQAKVREGDVIDVERLRADGEEVSFTPLLVVDAKGKVYSSRKELESAKVTAKVLGESVGEKIDIFKYKAKTGYRRRGGHRQRYTTIEVIKIEGPKKAKAPAASTTEAPPEDAEAGAPAEKTATAPKKTPAKKAPAKKPAQSKTATKSETAKKPAPKRPTAKKEE